MHPLILLLGVSLAAVSGAVALGHELLWTRRLVDLLGGSSEANTRVLSLFFLGLSLGAILAQRLLRTQANRMFLIGLAELFVGFSTLPVIFLSQLTDQLWPTLGWDGLIGIEGMAVKFLISLIVILPPSVAMGTTLPFLLAALFRHQESLGRQGIFIYAMNTAGGLFGLIAVVSLGLPGLGAFGTMCLLASINIGLGLLCLGLAGLPVFRERPLRSTQVRKPRSESQSQWRIPIFLAFLSGFGLLASEIIVLQTIMLVVPLSYHGPVAILASVVALLAIAAPVASTLSSKELPVVKRWTTRVLWLGGLAAVLSPIWYIVLVSSVHLGTASSVFWFSMKIVLLVLFSFGALFFAQGFLFPFTMILLEKECGDSVQDGAWCQLLAANGIGGLIGAEFAYRFLMPWFGVHVGLAIIGLLYLAVSTWIAGIWFPKAGWRAVSLAVGTVVTVMGVTQLPHMNPNLPFQILSQRIGADGLVAVIEGQGPGRAIVVSNQYILGSSSDRYTQARQAHLALLLHPDPRRVGFIGLATGITPGGAVQHTELEDIFVSEISKGVVGAARDYFQEYNGGVFQDPRARIVVEDGRTLVAASPESFDVLVGDLFLPWGAGASRLFSVEHFRSARQSLRDGGLFCQWLPMYQLTELQFERILVTFQQVFPTTYLLRNSASPLSPSVGLVGFREATLSWETVMQRTPLPSKESEIIDPCLLQWEIAAMHYLGIAKTRSEEHPPITLDNLWLEIDASRQQITGTTNEKYLSGAEWNRFLKNRLPEIVSIDTQSPAYAWQTQGLAILQWEWDLYEHLRINKPDGQSLVNSKKAILDNVPSSVRNSILKYPEAWSGSADLFR